MGGGASSVKFKDRIGYDHFEINRQVGQGGFGKVNAVQLNSTKELFAMKTLSKKTIVQSKNVQMIKNERDILARLDKNSNWVAGMHYAFQNSSDCFLVLTLALGGDLRYHMNHGNERRLDEERVKFYTRCLCEALVEVHKAGIIHRDIKPDNVVIKSNGYCLLTDFGISKIMDADGTCTGSSGTRSYMPPEALRKPHIQTKKVDSYSLGVLVYELLKTKSNNNSKSIINADRMNSNVNVDGKADLIEYDDLQASDHCKAFLRSCLLKDPDGRKNPDEMLDSEWLSGYDACKFRSQEIPAPWTPTADKGYFEGNSQNDFQSAFGMGGQKKEELVCAKDHDHGEFNGYDWNLTIADAS